MSDRSQVTTAAALAHLHILFEDSRAGGASHAPISVEVVDEDLEIVYQVSITEGEAAAVAVTPGYYWVQARLPSGERLRTGAEVGAGEVKEIALRAKDQNYAAFERSSFFRGASFRAAQLPPNPLEAVMADPLPEMWMRIWQHEDGDAGAIEQGWRAIPWRGSKPLRSNGMVSCELELDPSALSILQVGGPQMPWRCICLPPSTAQPLNVTIQPVSRQMNRNLAAVARMDGGVTVSVVSQNARAESLLGYLHENALESAALVADPLIESVAAQFTQQAVDVLTDPIEATIVGYYLLRIGSLDRLEDWVDSYAHWADWLPDATMILTWWHFRRRGKSVGLHYLTRGNLLITPVYTEGARLRADGLRLLGQNAASLGPYQFAIQETENAIDWSQPLTTIYGAGPDSPSQEPHFGPPLVDDDTTVWA
jgi:hypothetical protein